MIRFFNNEFRFAFSPPPRAFSYPFTKAFYQRIMRSVVRLFVVSFPFRVETTLAKVHTWAVMLKVNCFTSLQKGHLQSELYILKCLSSLRRVVGFACFFFFGSTTSNWFEGPIEDDRWKILKYCYFMTLCFLYFNVIHNNDSNWPNCLDQLCFHLYFWNTSILFFTRWLCLESDARIKSLLLKRSRYSFAFSPALFSSSHGKRLKEGWKRVQWTSVKLRDAFFLRNF